MQNALVVVVRDLAVDGVNVAATESDSDSDSEEEKSWALMEKMAVMDKTVPNWKEGGEKRRWKKDADERKIRIETPSVPRQVGSPGYTPYSRHVSPFSPMTDGSTNYTPISPNVPKTKERELV